MVSFLDLFGRVLPFVYAGITLAFTWLIARSVGPLLRRAMKESMPHVVANATRYSAVLIWVVGIVFAVQEIGLSTEVLLLLLAVGGAAVVVAFRGALENAGARYFSDVYIPYKLGDTIQVGSHAGKVVEINAMGTVLLSEKDRLISVPNQVFMREVVVNVTPAAWREVTIPISIGTNVDLPSFESEVRKRMTKLRPRLDSRFPPILSDRSRTDASTELTLTLFLRQAQDREPVTAEANRRISEALDVLRHPRREKPLPT